MGMGVGGMVLILIGGVFTPRPMRGLFVRRIRIPGLMGMEGMGVGMGGGMGVGMGLGCRLGLGLVVDCWVGCLLVMLWAVGLEVEGFKVM